MKIEMGESLLQSYLKYEKSCLLSQTNWKTAANWNIDEKSFEQIEDIFSKIQNHEDFSDIFKKSSLDQVLKQAELDVVGINKDTIYMVEVAFHENGLQYGGRLETKDRVCKKLLRAYLVGLAYFPNYSYEVLFASPKVNPATDSTIKEYFEVLNKDFSKEGKVRFNYIANNEFKEKILIPTLKASTDDSDTSELFLRSIKVLDVYHMVKLDEDQKVSYPKIVQIDKNTESTISNNSSVSISDSYETQIEFIPKNETLFKQLLLQKKQAKRTWIYKNGAIKTEIWDAGRFTITSNLRGNITSTNHWRSRKETGLIKIILEIEE